MIYTEKYQSVLQNMKIVTRTLRSLANKLHILAQQVNIFGINQFTDILPLTMYNYLEMRCNICLFQNPERKIMLSVMTVLIITVLYI
jgi:hypothetical protein